MNAQPNVRVFCLQGQKRSLFSRLRTWFCSLFLQKVSVRVIVLSPVHAQTLSASIRRRNPRHA
jgi:hypothetical protein